MMKAEPRIVLTPANQKKFEDRWNSIEDTEGCKKRVLERCRREREERERR